MDRHSIAQSLITADGIARPPARIGAVTAPDGEFRLLDTLRSRRQGLGWSLDELAERCGIAPQALREWERGLAAPRLDAAQHWAAALGLHLALTADDGAARQGLHIDWAAHRVSVDGAPVRLTPMEWRALERLARTPGEVVTHQVLYRHLYGEERPYRAQSTAIRVLITKLRRLLPLRIEAQWGKGYVVSGIEPSTAVEEEATDDLEPSPAGTTCSGPLGAMPVAVPPARRVGAVVTIDPPARPCPEVPPIRRPACRAEELGVIERFLAERGATRCPDVATIQHAPLPTLVWDKAKRKWVRPAAGERQAV